ncbi:MAG: SHOCT domain-containing protein [Christensenellales bacterium]
MKTKQKNNVLLIIACVLSYLSIILSVLLAVFLTFNIAGTADIYKELLLKIFVYNTVDLAEQVTLYIVELGISALLNLYFACFYLKVLRYKINNQQFGRMLVTKAIFQMLFASLISGVFALIAGIVMGKKKSKVSPSVQSDNPYFSDYKMEAMSEAIKRLKELKAKGAISEEEYYISLNKILES